MGKLTEAEAEMMEGYRDGREDTRDEPKATLTTGGTDD